MRPHDRRRRVPERARACGRFSRGRGFEAVLGEDWQEKLDSAEVTFADDDHATIAPWGAEEDPTELVREEGEWLLVSEES